MLTIERLNQVELFALGSLVDRRVFDIGDPRLGNGNLRSADARLDEAEGLAEAIGIDVVGRRAFRLREPRPATLFGKGQAEAIADLVESHEAGLLIVDAALAHYAAADAEVSEEVLGAARCPAISSPIAPR